MKRYIIILLSLFPFAGWVAAQDKQVIETSSGENLAEKVLPQVQYIFPEFTTGDVYFLDDSKGSAMLNYNRLIGEMQFLEGNNVMAIDEVKKIIFVDINHRKFYPLNRNEFTEELLTTRTYALHVLHRAYATPHSKKGGYGTSSSAAAITTYNAISGSNKMHDLTVTENVLITLHQKYYLVGAKGRHILIKNSRTFTKLFPNHREQIETFVMDNDLWFHKEEDLKKILEYCNNLSN